MTEGLKHPEHLSLPEHWGEHGPKDDCVSNPWVSLLDLSKDERKAWERDRNLFYRLSKAQGEILAGDIPFATLRELRPGSVFDASTVEPGTILGIQEEFGGFIHGDLEWYTDKQIWGVVCEPKSGGGIGRAIAIWDPTKIGPLYISYREPLINIGTTVHSKYRGPGNIVYDTVVNTNKVRVLLPGTTQRQNQSTGGRLTQGWPTLRPSPVPID